MSQKGRVFKVDVTENGTLKTHYVSKTEFTVGRGQTCDVIILDTNISREHLKINFDDGIRIQDMKSSNGTLVNGSKIAPAITYQITESDVIKFGRSEVAVQISSFEQENVMPSPVVEPKEEIKINIEGFSDTEEEIRMDFKDISVDIKKYKDPGHHAKEILTEANYIKQTILKNANVEKKKILNEARLQAKAAADKAYDAYRAKLDFLINGTKEQMQLLKIETESHLDDKKLHAMQEIDNLWKEHHDQVSHEKEVLIQRLKKENEDEIQLLRERLNNEMFIEKNKLLTEAESTVMAQKVAYRAQFDNEKNEHTEKINLLSKQIEEYKSEIDSSRQKLDDIVSDLTNKQLDYDKALSNLKIEQDKLDILKTKRDELDKHNSKIQENLNNYNKLRDDAIEAESKAKKAVTELNDKMSQLSIKKNELQNSVEELEKNVANSKAKAKIEVESEYNSLRKIESEKFEALKVNELKELQKIREEHTNSFKKFSVEISQEIAVKLEMLQKSGHDLKFEKSLEIINSVIQVKSAALSGTESNHTVQIDHWKQKQKSQKISVFMSGAVAAVFVYFAGSFAYKKLSTDSLKQELQMAAEIRKQKEIENAYVPEKKEELHDSYVDSTLYTQNFVDVYLDDAYHDEWVKKVTMYFLKTWKLDEQKTIQVIANSRSLVQNIDEASRKLTKSKLKQDIERLKTLESANIKDQVEILGTNVRYEAYKKLEYQFFNEKLQKRRIASP